MKVLHYHTEDTTENHAKAQQMLSEGHYDVLHVYGCWHFGAWRMARQAITKGTRLVVSPEGQLEPWVVKSHYWKDKLPKRMLFQKWMVQQAYAVIIQGKMEEECLRQLGWNPRLVIIRNPLYTNTITTQEAERQKNVIYRQVMNTNTLQLMTADTRKTLRDIIKAGITRDERWIGGACMDITDQDQWHHLLCYAWQERISEVVERGISILRLTPPDIEAEIKQSTWFIPEGYETPKSIESVIGMQFATENERLIATFRHLRKLVQQRQLAICHLVELDCELRHHQIVEDRLCDALEEKGLYKLAARLMQVTHEVTGLEEGLMPVPPRNDYQARRIRKQIDNHLKL